ncbi:DEAD/DEAH box helicase family protein [Sinorhizobium sp. BG8]|uniref:DEAD/DEAH box helicase family protein n=1 Tax=Sinorhizobium sp. BG8 TaxID=2613773 RepID=UPI001FEF70F5|nr:DEAD/DEAH box helicase family protein [Sinorhizobium sp. BG8]
MSITKQEKQQEEDQILSLLKDFHHDIPLFALTVFGSQLRPVQVEIAEKYQNSKRTTVRGGVGFGKTHVMAILIWWALMTHDDVQVTIFGPTEGTIERNVWKELNILHSRMAMPFKDWFEVSAKKIKRISNPAGCFATYALASTDNIAAARGIHQINNFVFVDEADGVPDEVYTEALENILTDINPKLCLISNPSKTSGYFWETWNGQAAKLWAHVHGRMSDAPHVTEEDLEAKAIAYGGRDTRMYRIMVEGEFPDDDVDGLIPKWAVDEAVNNPDAVPAASYPVIWVSIQQTVATAVFSSCAMTTRSSAFTNGTARTSCSWR